MVFYHQLLRLFQNDDGSEDLFLLIFHQNTFTKDWFTTEEEFLETNTFHKYSILKYINDEFKTENVFEFIMDYPEVGKFGRWTQSKNPLETEQNENVLISEKGSTWDRELSFIGLHQSSVKTACFLEGTNETNPEIGNDWWYYAIGQKTEWINNILASFDFDSKKYSIHQVYLWLKITNLSLLKGIFHHCSCQLIKSFLRLNIFCFTAILL